MYIDKPLIQYFMASEIQLVNANIDLIYYLEPCHENLFEPRHEKTGFLHMPKFFSREADQRLCFRYKYSTIPQLP